MRFMVTGGAGFIGSNLTDRLLSEGHDVLVYDNFSTGRRELLQDALESERCTLVAGDILDAERLSSAMVGVDFVYHLAANADVRSGLQHPAKDLEQNTLGTFRVLEAMRGNGVQQIAFISTGSVYGEPNVFPTPEDAPFPVQTSLYGASKLAGESLLQAYCEGYGFQAWIFRLVSILGERYTHGHVFDFCSQLRQRPRQLYVLGDGTQRKSYLYVGDCVSALRMVPDVAKDAINILNLGTDHYCTVAQSAGWILSELGLEIRTVYGGGERGWVGDSPFIWLDCSRARGLGWIPEFGIQASVMRTVQYLMSNEWVFDAR
jgi:UDP-glucose 4-epimerase